VCIFDLYGRRRVYTKTQNFFLPFAAQWRNEIFHANIFVYAGCNEIDQRRAQGIKLNNNHERYKTGTTVALTLR
jgi:hypothetical protein